MAGNLMAGILIGAITGAAIGDSGTRITFGSAPNHRTSSINGRGRQALASSMKVCSCLAVWLSQQHVMGWLDIHRTP